MKDFTLPHPTSTSQCLLWPARSTLYQAPPRGLLKVTALQDRVQAVRPVGLVLLGVYVVARGLGLLLNGIQSFLDRFLHQRAHCTRKKGSRHSAWWDMNGPQKAWPYSECGRKATITCLGHRVSHRSENVLRFERHQERLKGNFNLGFLGPPTSRHG